MSAPTLGTMRDLIHQTRTRTLHADEARLLREGLTALDRARAGADGLQRALHHADHDNVIYAAALHRIAELLTAWQTQPPRAALTAHAIDTLHAVLAPALALDTA